MKKLMFAFAAVAMAACAQAASVTWSCEGSVINGTPTSWDGDPIPTGWGVYVFNEADYSRSQMVALFAADTFDAATFTSKALLNADTEDHVAVTGGGAFAVYGTEMAGVPDDIVSGYAVIVDAASIADAKYAYITGISSDTVKDTGAAKILVGDLFGGGYLDATNYDDKTGWSKINAGAVPEPTSGLLLLLGVAGLALKRRRA